VGNRTPIGRAAAFRPGAAGAIVRAMQKELAHRENDGIAVTLWWDSCTNRVEVAVSDGDDYSFALEVRPENALDAFQHPFAYAA
jgi:hypothetical protein